MGNVFSCVVPKTGRLKKPKDNRWKKQKKSQLQKLFESNDVKLHHELLDVDLDTTTGEKLAEEARANNKKMEEKEIVIEDLCFSDVTWAMDYLKTKGDDVAPTGSMAPSDLYIEDLDLYDSENEALCPEPTKRIFHDKTEDWGHFHTELEREYTEQLEDDLGEDFTDTAAAAAEEFAEENAEFGKELLNLVLARVDDIAACRERARRAEQAFKAFKQRAWRAEHTPDELSDSDDSEDGDDDRFTPPPVEGDIYTGHGILKKFNNRNENHRRGITWAAGVKPPASDQKVLDPLLEAFMNERSRLALQRTPEEKRMRRKARLSRASCRQVNNSNSSGQITAGCRIPVPVRKERALWAATYEGVSRHRQWSTPTRIPVATRTRAPEQTPVIKDVSTTTKLVKKQSVTKHTEVGLPKNLSNVNELQTGPDRGISWPERIEDLFSVSTKAYYIEQFQRTELFRQRYRRRMTGSASWEKGLTPFQIWVVRHADTDGVTRLLQPATTSRPNTAKARVACWRRHGAFY